MNKYFFVGIKGSGMASLSQVLVDLGHEVIGSDCNNQYFTDEILNKNNIKVYEFNTFEFDNSFIYIISNAYKQDHLEVSKIIKNNYKYYYYHEFIEEFFKNTKIGVSGTHGKTTTATFLKQLFNNECNAIIGDGCGCGGIEYKYTIIEACEYQDHILAYTFDYLIINNIDNDHLDYFKNLDHITQTFKKASKKAKCLIVNEDISITHPNKYTFGFNPKSYCHATILETTKEGYLLLINIDHIEFRFRLLHQGKHMILNFLASLLCSYLVLNKINFTLLSNLSRPKRRMEEVIYKDHILIDDYAHHPTEIKALLKAVYQKYIDKDIYIILQPHTYSRTILLKDEFKECFNGYRNLYVYKTFTSKREDNNMQLETQVQEIFNEFTYLNDLDEIDILLNSKRNAVFVFVGAGNVFCLFKNYLNIN